MKKILSILFLILVVGCSNSNTVNNDKTQLEKIKETGKIVIGLEGNWQPWSYHNESDELVGYDVEVGNAIAKELGVTAEFIEGPWDGLFAGLSSGRYDLVINGVDITEEREKEFLFSVPYAYTHTVLITSEDNTSIASFEDLKGKTTANSIGSTYMEIGESFGASTNGVDSLEETLTMVLYGRVDATINSDMSFADYMKINPNAKLKVVDTLDEVVEVGIPMVNGENSKTLKQEIDNIINKLKNNGTLSELSLKYFNIDVSNK